MKRIFITLVAVWACVFNANAQLVVDSLGKVSVGEETDPQSQVYVLDKANENGLTVHNMARIRSRPEVSRRWRPQGRWRLLGT